MGLENLPGNLEEEGVDPLSEQEEEGVDPLSEQEEEGVDPLSEQEEEGVDPLSEQEEEPNCVLAASITDLFRFLLSQEARTNQIFRL